jgi:hypothetical protein
LEVHVIAKPYRWIGAIALLAAACCFVAPVGYGAPEGTKPVPSVAKWEYKVVRVGRAGSRRTAKDIEDALKGLGDEGWEISNVVCDVGSLSAEHPVQTEVHVILKRPGR